ncbi:MAG TPA: ribonuclease HI [Candidatus Paceibacterota bacterium]|nr:ribonuclease HI [Candidatus Paceibacterota bacterium]
MKKKIEIYTDGSSLGNPGPGGWGVVFTENNKIIKELGGYSKNTTNNRMELTAVIETLKDIIKNHIEDDIAIFADSNYVLLGLTAWIHNWERNGWRTAGKKQVMNQDLWKELIELTRSYNSKIKWEKVKGHSDHIYNDRADEIATTYAAKQKGN